MGAGGEDFLNAVMSIGTSKNQKEGKGNLVLGSKIDGCFTVIFVQVN